MQVAASSTHAPPVAALGGSGLIFWILLIVVLWLVMFLPQRQQQKRRQEMLRQLKRGLKVVTIGGIHGTVTDVKDDVVVLQVADKVELTVSRSAIASIESK